MVYKAKEGILKEKISRLSLFFIGSMLALAASFATFSTASATSHGQSFDFTQSELDTNWEADRQFPSDGATSVTEFGRDNVARLGIDSSETTAGTFTRTEGIKTVGAQDFGEKVQVDLYVDPEWEDTATRAGLWVVGDNGAGDRDELFGIIEFVNLEPSTSGDSAQGDHEGWRIWDSNIGWLNVPADFEYGEWTTLSIELDTTLQQYNYYVDGNLVGSATGGENFIREVFLNSYNYGLDEFPNLDNESYAAHWHGGLVEEVSPESKDECKKGGYETFGFRNQGQCIRFVNTGQDSRTL